MSERVFGGHSSDEITADVELAIDGVLDKNDVRKPRVAAVCVVILLEGDTCVTICRAATQTLADVLEPSLGGMVNAVEGALNKQIN